MKNFKMLAFALILFMLFGFSVNAASTISGISELETCLSKSDSVCILGSNIVAENSLFVNVSNVILDLNGYTLSLDKDVYENAVIVIEHGGKLTIKDSSSAQTGKVSYITDLTTDKVRVAIKMTKSGGDNTKVAELVVESGTLEGDSYAISGNGNPKRDNTKITINGGNLYAKTTGIFQPQVGNLIVNGGTIEGKTGIEVRSGDLTVNGGTIIGTGVPTETEKNGNGITTTGAGIAVVQHTTNHDINVMINGGTLKGYTPFYQASVEDNSDETKVSLNIKNGNFVITNEGESALYSGDKTEFIKGGTYSANVNEEYIATGLVSKKIGDTYTVGKENSVTISKVTAGKAEVDKAKAVVGEKITLTLTPNEGYELSSIKVVDTYNKEVSVTGNTFVMPNSSVTIEVVFTKVTITSEIPVVDPDKKVDEPVVGVKDETSVEEVILETISKDTELASKLEGTSVKVEVEIDKVETSNVPNEVAKAMKEKAGKATITNFFDITIAVKDAKGEINETISELTKEIELMVVLPEELKLAKDGMTRKYYVVREHVVDGKSEVDLLEAKVSEDGKYLVFKTDKFSTYAIAYEDVKPTTPSTPQTGDSVMLYIALGFVSIAAIGISLNSLKRRSSK